MPTTPSQIPTTALHELTKFFLFLRTASAAILSTKAQIESTKAYVQWNAVNGYYSEHCSYQEEQENEEKELRVWEERWVEAGVGIVDWTAKRVTGKWLPPEILGVIGEMLRDDGLVLKRIW